MKKKLIVWMAAAALALSMTGCGNAAKAEETVPVSTENGVTTMEIGSLDEMNGQEGGRIFAPEGASDESVYVIMNDGSMSVISAYDYSLEGRSYSVRFCSDFTIGITGCEVDGEEPFADPDAADFHDLSVLDAGDKYIAHWCTVDGQYVMMTDSNNLDAESFLDIAWDYMDGTIPAES